MSQSPKTDISEKNWEDLYGSDENDGIEYTVLRELAGEREGVHGHGNREELCVGIFAHDGRVEEIPDELREEHEDVIEQARQEIDGGEDENEQDDTDADDDHEEEQADYGGDHEEEQADYGGDHEEEQADDDDDELDGQTYAVDQDDDDESEEQADDEQEIPTDDRHIEDDDDEDTGRDKKLGSGSKHIRRDCSFIINAGVFKKYLDYISTLVDECKINVSEDGFTVRAVDPANVGMVDAHLKSRAFESYDVDDTGVLGVNLDRLLGVMGGPGKDDLVHMEYEADTRNLVIEFSGHTFRISLIEPDSIRKEPNLPDLDLSVEVRFDEAGVLDDALAYADDVTDHVAMLTDQDGSTDTFKIKGEGDTDDYTGEFRDGEEVYFKKIGIAQSLYSLEYLNDMRKSWDSDENLWIQVGQEFPCRIQQDLVHGDDGEVYGEIEFMLAPRIQSD